MADPSAVPYTIALDNPDNARELTIKGATFAMLNVPEGTAIGIDQQMFLVGPKFRGVKMLPPGPHVIAYRSSSQGSFSPTTCFFVHPRGGQVLTWTWDAPNEILVPIKDTDEVERLVNAVKTFQLDQYLAPYDLNKYAQWKKLTSHITADVIQAIQPSGEGNINILAESQPASINPTIAEAALEEQLLRNASNSTNQQQTAAPHAGRCTYTTLPRLVKKAGLTPADLTALNLDKSKLLEELIETTLGGKEDALLGELQFSFLAFLIGQSIESFQQWKAILTLMLSCEEAALEQRSTLFTDFLRVLYNQLQLCFEAATTDDDANAMAVSGCFEIMFEDMMQDMFLKRAFQQWLSAMKEEQGSVSPGLMQQAQRVARLLESRLGWDLTEDDEDGPVIVDL